MVARDGNCHRALEQHQDAEISAFAVDLFGLQDTFDAISDTFGIFHDHSHCARDTTENITQEATGDPAEDVAIPESSSSPLRIRSSHPAQPEGIHEERRSSGQHPKPRSETDAAPIESARSKNRALGSRSIPLCALTDIFSQQAVLHPPTELPSPTRYGYLEKSFTRHLYRSCLHRTLRLLGPRDFQIPDVDPFKIASRFFTGTELRSACLLKLFGPSGIPFDHLDQPYLNIGGSGTHYSRLDMCGEPLLDTEAWSMWRKTDFPDFKFEIDSQDLSSFLSDDIFRGEWFDPNDVEQYLRSAGVPLTGNPSVLHFTFRRRHRRLDVSQLIAHLSEQGICLGRSPGFRRMHIMRAIQMSSHVV